MAKAKSDAPDQTDEEQPIGDAGDKPAKQQIREAFQGGKSRREIADEFGLSYQRVYQVTKDMGDPVQPRSRVTVEASENLTKGGREDLVGTSRVDAIRELFDEGMKVGDIAKLLGTSYQVVFQATRAQRAAIAGDGDDEAGDTEGSDADGDEDDDEDDE